MKENHILTSEFWLLTSEVSSISFEADTSSPSSSALDGTIRF